MFKKKAIWGLMLLLGGLEANCFADLIDLETELHRKPSVNTNYYFCLEPISKQCLPKDFDFKKIPLAAQQPVLLEQTEMCIHSLVEKCDQKFEILRTETLDNCYQSCDATRYTDFGNCSDLGESLQTKWRNCIKEVVGYSKQCHQSCVREFLGDLVKDRPLTTDPFGVGVDDQKLQTIKHLMDTPLPGGENW